jgi:hypothetical protein
MLYVKVKKETLIQYPYGYAELQADNPYTNFNGLDLYPAFQGTEVNLSGHTLETVFTEDAPAYDQRTQRLVSAEAPVYEGGRWVIKLQVVNKTPEELAEQEAAQAAAVRSERNARLAACDWTQLADAPVDDLAWAAYRQELRDVPNQPGFPWDVQWPAKPE